MYSSVKVFTFLDISLFPGVHLEVGYVPIGCIGKCPYLYATFHWFQGHILLQSRSTLDIASSILTFFPGLYTA